ncbi:hypothetical protein [Sutcliffiella sp. NC1]|uniref:hypothetical protein n=1 Tax=Sutcliffiella sp. NC1 TaxID=3004096 RepID=UPI0022DD3CE9|nr:hypothetical protein [Sutcliffiella sp. NC1]WBL16788.1 hypothetical protein O1A01_09195 [Sutcliffiella sp. NC1]
MKELLLKMPIDYYNLVVSFGGKVDVVIVGRSYIILAVSEVIDFLSLRSFSYDKANYYVIILCMEYHKYY